MGAKTGWREDCEALMRKHPGLSIINRDELNHSRAQQVLACEAQCGLPRDWTVQDIAERFLAACPQYNPITEMERAKNMIMARAVSDSQMLRDFIDFCAKEKQQLQAA